MRSALSQEEIDVYDSWCRGAAVRKGKGKQSRHFPNHTVTLHAIARQTKPVRLSVVKQAPAAPFLSHTETISHNDFSASCPRVCISSPFRQVEPHLNFHLTLLSKRHVVRIRPARRGRAPQVTFKRTSERPINHRDKRPVKVAWIL